MKGCVENGGEGNKRQDLEGGREGEEQLGTLSTNELESGGKRQGKRCEIHFGACESFLQPQMSEMKGMYFYFEHCIIPEKRTLTYKNITYYQNLTRYRMCQEERAIEGISPLQR